MKIYRCFSQEEKANEIMLVHNLVSGGSKLSDFRVLITMRGNKISVESIENSECCLICRLSVCDTGGERVPSVSSVPSEYLKLFTYL